MIIDPDYIPAEVLRAQDGKKVKVTLADGRVIGEGEFHYQEDVSRLEIDMRLDNVEVGAWLMDQAVIFEKDK